MELTTQEYNILKACCITVAKLPEMKADAMAELLNLSVKLSQIEKLQEAKKKKEEEDQKRLEATKKEIDTSKTATDNKVEGKK